MISGQLTFCSIAEAQSLQRASINIVKDNPDTKQIGVVSTMIIGYWD